MNRVLKLTYMLLITMWTLFHCLRQLICYRVPDSDWPTVASGGYLVIDTTLSTMNVTAFESRYYDFWAVMSQTIANTATTDKITAFAVFVAVSVVFTKIFCCS